MIRFIAPAFTIIHFKTSAFIFFDNLEHFYSSIYIYVFTDLSNKIILSTLI
jgi:hypothetical protein